MKAFALAIFIIMYVIMIAKPKWRPWTALTAGALFLITGVLPFKELGGVINWNVLMMIGGTMVLVDFFIESKMPGRIAELLMDKSKNVMWVTIYMSLFSGIISAFIDNVATVLMVAPVGLAVCKKLKISPVPMTASIVPENSMYSWTVYSIAANAMRVQNETDAVKTIQGEMEALRVYMDKNGTTVSSSVSVQTSSVVEVNGVVR